MFRKSLISAAAVAGTVIASGVAMGPSGHASAATTCSTSNGYHGSITSISGTTAPATLVLQSDHCGAITVNVSSSTKLYRRYMGISELDEYSNGDVVTVWGMHTNATTLNGALIHNISIQRAWSRVTGIVSAVNATTVTLQVNHTRTMRNTIGRGQSVTLPISTSTRFITGFGKNIKVKSGVTDATTMVNVNSHITALGVWNRTNQSYKETWRLRVLKA